MDGFCLLPFSKKMQIHIISCAQGRGEHMMHFPTVTQVGQETVVRLLSRLKALGEYCFSFETKQANVVVYFSLSDGWGGNPRRIRFLSG